MTTTEPKNVRDWGKEFDEMWNDTSFGGVVRLEVKDFIYSILKNIEQEVDGKSILEPGKDDYEHERLLGRNAAINEIITIIRSYMK